MKPIPELLAEHPFFEGLPADDLAALAACGEEVSFGAGEVIFREGTPADRMYVLRAGRVGLEIHALGRPAHLVTTLAAGERRVSLPVVVSGTLGAPALRLAPEAVR